MLCGAGRRFVYNGRGAGTSAFGNNNTVCTGAFCRTDDCSHVVGITDFIADDDEWIFISLFCKIQNIFKGAVAFYGTYGNDTLVRLCYAHEIQLAFVAVDNHDAGFSGSGSNKAQCVIRVAFGTIDLVSLR